jgi:hypothetical protein
MHIILKNVFQFLSIISILTHLKTEFLPNSEYKFSSFLTGNTLLLHYMYQPVNAVKEKIVDHSENHKRDTNILCGQKAEFRYVKPGGAYRTTGL